ncbi:hypothetical protein Peur_066781 [Populus x canadensis]
MAESSVAVKTSHTTTIVIMFIYYNLFASECGPGIYENGIFKGSRRHMLVIRYMPRFFWHICFGSCPYSGQRACTSHLNVLKLSCNEAQIRASRGYQHGNNPRVWE